MYTSKRSLCHFCAFYLIKAGDIYRKQHRKREQSLQNFFYTFMHRCIAHVESVKHLATCSLPSAIIKIKGHKTVWSFLIAPTCASLCQQHGSPVAPACAESKIILWKHQLRRVCVQQASPQCIADGLPPVFVFEDPIVNSISSLFNLWACWLRLAAVPISANRSNWWFYKKSPVCTSLGTGKEIYYLFSILKSKGFFGFAF